MVKKSICLFCSLGCGVALRVKGTEATAVDFDKDNPVNKGSLCPRGFYNYELLNHPRRLTEPRIGERKVVWDEAVNFILQGLKEFNPEEIGIALSAQSSNEDALMAARLAKDLGTKNVMVAADPSDNEACEGEKWEVPVGVSRKIEEIGSEELLLIIGDVLTRSPVLARKINQIKNGKRGNQIIVIDPGQSHTSWFATTQLKCDPGQEALVLAALIQAVKGEAISGQAGLAAETIKKAALAFSAAASATIIFVPSRQKGRNDLLNYFARTLAAISGENKKCLTLYSFGNCLGVNMILDNELEGRAPYQEVINKIESGTIKAMFILGEDFSYNQPDLARKVRHLKFVVRSSYFAAEASVLLPLASPLEVAGSYLRADGRAETVLPIVTAAGGKSNSEIIARIINSELDFTGLSGGSQRSFAKPVNLREKISEAKDIPAGEPAAEENITHFGTNETVRHFFWYRVNNKNG